MKKITPAKAGTYAVLTCWALTTLYPFVWVILNSFRERGLIRKDSFSVPLPGSGFTMGNYAKAMERFDFGNAYVNSLIMAGMMFPVFSTIIPVFRMEAAWGIASSGNRWLSLLAVILPQIAGNLCFAIIVLMGFIESVPIELEESAYMDGCNVFQVYFHIIMPAAKSSFATVSIFSFLWSYNDLFTQNFFLRVPKEKTITLLLNEISSQAGVDYGLMAASVVLIVVPVLIVYVALQKHIIKGLTAGAIKG